MFKKLLKAGMTFALLLGCYVAYGHAFDFMVQRFRTYRSKEIFGFVDSPLEVQAACHRAGQAVIWPRPLERHQ